MTHRFSSPAFRESRELRFSPGGFEGPRFEGPDPRMSGMRLDGMPRLDGYNRVHEFGRGRAGIIGDSPTFRNYPGAAGYNYGRRIGPMVSSLAAARGYQRHGYGPSFGESPNQMRAAHFAAIANFNGGTAAVGNQRVPDNRPQMMLDPKYSPPDFSRYINSPIPSVAQFARFAQMDQAKYMKRGDDREMYRFNQIHENTGRMEQVWCRLQAIEQQYAGQPPLVSQRINVQGWNVHDALWVQVEKPDGTFDVVQHKPYSAVQFEDWKSGNSLRIMEENGIVIKMKVNRWMEGVKPFPESVTVELHKPGTYCVDGKKVVVGGGTVRSPDASPSQPYPNPR